MSSIASYIILLYISICFVQPQSTDFSTATIVTDRIPSEPNTDASDSPKPTDANSPSAPFVSAGTSNVGDSSPIPNQGTGASSAVALSTHSGSMLSDASASGQTNPSSTSSTTSTTSTSTTASTTTFATVDTINAMYGYVVRGTSLHEAIINDSAVRMSVQNEVVEKTFNSTFLRLNVTQVEISRRSRADPPIDYNMVVSILFYLRLECNKTCLDTARINGTSLATIRLPLQNGTLTDVSVTLQAQTLEELIPVNPKGGESPPGLAARLGMGLGISFLAVLLIGEIVFLYLKFKS